MTVNSHDMREVSVLWQMSCRILEKQKKNDRNKKMLTPLDAVRTLLRQEQMAQGLTAGLPDHSSPVQILEQAVPLLWPSVKTEG